jgi:hypothetical protein
MFPGLTLNRPHTAILKITDNSGLVASTAFNFDTFNSTNYTFEAEDYDYNGGKFFDNPQHGAYSDLAGIDGIDYHSVNPGQGNDAYRPNPPGLETENCTDQPRLAFSPGLQDYDVGFSSTGNWGNYTRTFPAGNYNIYLRGSDGAGSTSDSASLSVVTSGQTTTNQTIAKAGVFSVPATGDWQTYTWVPLEGSGGSLVQMTNNGSVKTLRVTVDNGSYNANFYLLVPVYTPPPATALAVSAGGENSSVSLSFLTQAGYNYQVEYTTNLTDAVWIPLGIPIPGDGTIHSAAEEMGATAGAGTSRFYRVQIQ